MSSGTVAVGGVSGVVSGAAACRRLAAEVQYAVAEFSAAMSRARAGIASVGIDTVSAVQLQVGSDVVGALQNGAEEAAYVQRSAANVGDNLSAALYAAAAGFDRRNS